MAPNRLILVRVGNIEIDVAPGPVTGTNAASGQVAKTAGNALEAFGRPQDAIIEVAKSTAQMIDKAGVAQSHRVEVEFGLKFSASGIVIMAGAAGETSFKVTLDHDADAKPVAGAASRSSRRTAAEPSVGSS